MGHTSGKDIYRTLGKKIDGHYIRAPWSDTFYRLLKELYTEEEAYVAANMPYSIANIDRIAKTTGYTRERLKGLLESLADKGLVMDLYSGEEYHYIISPLVIGIFEFTMMRTGENLNTKEWAELFHHYMFGTDDLFKSNERGKNALSLLRALPHKGSVADKDVVEILPYEKAEEIVESHNIFSIGICSCRHEKQHLGIKGCDTPLKTCTTFGYAADYLIRHNLSKKVTRQEVLDNFERCRNLGLVFSADTVKKNVTFICCCCSCCCNVLQAIQKFGSTSILMTSNYIAAVNTDECSGCGMCSKACPIKVINLEPVTSSGDSKKKHYPRVDQSMCVGCGVCALKCKTGALKLKKREQRIIYPETTFERNILLFLDQGNLQNILFDNPNAITHRVMRGILGGFLRLPPVKRALMGDTFRSRFLSKASEKARNQGDGWFVDL